MIETKIIEPYADEPDKERFLATLKRKKVDRVPNNETLIDSMHVEKILGKYSGSTIAYGGDPGKGPAHSAVRPMYPDDYIDLCNIIGQDVMTLDGGFWTPFKKEDRNGKLVQVIDKSVKTRKDFESLILDSKPQIDYDIKYIREYKETLRRRNSRIGITYSYGCILQTLYEFVVGMNDFMIMCYDDMQLVEDMLEVSTEYFIKLTEVIIGEGVDFIFPADDVAFKGGLFIPPKIMKEIWVPRVARIIEPAVNAGVPVMFHSDGKIDDIVEDLIDIGIDCINPMDPYSVDYRDYKKKYGDRLCLSGNVDIDFPLARGTPEDVVKDVEEHMKFLKPGYGYVATCSHSIGNNIPHENFVAYINAIHEYGRY
ncbi:MAG: hypothetical protein M1308_04505 [Actinobacteria bacterium]|nr:hypothetical protein [Actinomycetota bacterium]